MAVILCGTRGGITRTENQNLQALGRSAFGFEVDKNFYERAKNEMLDFSEKIHQMTLEEIMQSEKGE